MPIKSRNPFEPGDLLHALKALVLGDGVRRTSHELKLDGVDVSEQFRDELRRAGYRETAVADVDIRPGERVPAFYLENGCAHFGWVFWEVFSPDRRRKIFGSVLKNAKGDWAILLARKAVVYSCASRKESMDVDRPSSF